MSEVHFEVFRQTRRGGAWALVEVMAQRDEAVEWLQIMIRRGEKSMSAQATISLTDNRR